MKQTTVITCQRGKETTVKVMLELKPETLRGFIERSKEFQGGKYTAKQMMENVLNNQIEGVVVA